MEHRALGTTGVSIPVVGQGTWNIGGGFSSSRASDSAAVEALQLGFEVGMRLIDTAEMYGAGHSEEIIAQAIQNAAQPIFIATKVSPSHFEYDSVLRAASGSLKRLGVKQIDLYQLHWPNPRVPISETMKAMEKLVRDGLVRYVGVSNFSVEQMREAQDSMSHEKIVANQIEYSLLSRSVEEKIVPYCEKEGITVIAYSPLAQGGIPRGRGAPFKILDEVADELGRTRSQVAISWLLQNPSTVVIPKAVKKEHVQENATISGTKLSSTQYEKLSEAFA
jgi:diketogulonate reductase-like aldo/keto reductase